jgi:hypothetical protein
VDVYAVQLNALIEFEKVANIKRDKDKADVMTTFASLDLKGLNEQHLAVTKGETDLLLRQISRIEKGIAYYMPDPVGDALRQKQDKRDDELNQKIIAKFKASDVEGLYKKVNSLAPIVFYTQEIKSYLTDASVQKVVSDSEGKFTMSLKGDDVVLVAIAKGKNGDPAHFWMVKLPADDKKVTLSDANFFDKGCPTCSLTGTDKTLDSAKELSMAAYIISAYIMKEPYKLSKERSWIFDYAKKANLI